MSVLHTFPCMWKFDVHVIFTLVYVHVGSSPLPFHLTALLIPLSGPALRDTITVSFFTFHPRVPLSFLVIIFLWHILILLHTSLSFRNPRCIHQLMHLFFFFWTNRACCAIQTGMEREILPSLNVTQRIKTSHHCQTVV